MAPPIFGGAAITLGIGPHSTYSCNACISSFGCLREYRIMWCRKAAFRCNYLRLFVDRERSEAVSRAWRQRVRHANDANYSSQDADAAAVVFVSCRCSTRRCIATGRALLRAQLDASCVSLLSRVALAKLCRARGFPFARLTHFHTVASVKAAGYHAILKRL